MMLLGGGVACNTHIQKAFKQSFTENFSEAKVFVPENVLSTDNALMIAFAGYMRILHDKNCLILADSRKAKSLKADGNWSLS